LPGPFLPTRPEEPDAVRKALAGSSMEERETKTAAVPHDMA
jgi:hypothetical protein